MTIYLVRNQSGQFFRAKGQSGLGQSWVDDIAKARIYTKIGPAKATVTFYTQNFPKFGTPSILVLELDVTKATVMDMTETTSKSIAEKKRKDLTREKVQNERDKAYLQTQMDSINQRMAALKNA